MSSPPLVKPGPVERHARLAVAAMFFTNGALFANLVPRYPEIKADLDLTNAAYGLSVAAFPTGAIVAGMAAGVLVRRFGSGAVAVGGTLLTGAGVLAAGLSPSVLLFAAALFLGGAMDAITDVAQNAHGLEVQRRYGRSIINSFHAIWSIGAVTGGAMAAAAIALELPLGVHLTISGVIFAAVALVALRFCLPRSSPPLEPTLPSAQSPDGSQTSSVGSSADDGPETGPASGGPAGGPSGSATPAAAVSGRPSVSPRIWLMVGALVLIAIGGALVEDAGSSWAAVYLSGSLDAAASVAAWGFIALVGSQFIGRLVGDRLVDRFGQRTVARAGGIIVAVGMGTALTFPSVAGTIIGFAAAGFGVATLVPAAMHEADELPGLKPGTGLTIVSWLMRLGFLLSPPVVGAVADASSLRAGLVVVPIAGVLVIVLAGVLQPRRPATRTEAD